MQYWELKYFSAYKANRAVNAWHAQQMGQRSPVTEEFLGL